MTDGSGDGSMEEGLDDGIFFGGDDLGEIGIIFVGYALPVGAVHLSKKGSEHEMAGVSDYRCDQADRKPQGERKEL